MAVYSAHSMPNPLHTLFRPLHRLIGLPDTEGYQHARRQWMLRRVLDRAQLGTVRTVVEVGCGDGWVASRLAERFERVIGFDINPWRIKAVDHPRILLVAGNADEAPIADGAADLIVSLVVMEHVPDRVETFRRLSRSLGPGGRMLHVVPTSSWKALQWIGFVPDVIRKHTRGVLRALAGERKQKRGKFHEGRETNNPHVSSRQPWWQKLYPRVHGAYDSNLDEFVRWSTSHWIRSAQAAGLRVTQVVPLGVSSPYGFGISRVFGWWSWLGVSTIVGLVMERAATPGAVAATAPAQGSAAA